MKIDYSKILRKDVDEENTWEITDIFENVKLWIEEKEEVVLMIPKIEEVKKEWLSSAKKFYELLELVGEIDKKLSYLYLYVSLLYDTNMEDTKAQEMQGEIENIYVEFSTSLSFMEADILKLGESGFKEYLNEIPQLKVYELRVENILSMKEHVLDEAKQGIVSLTGLFSGNLHKTSSLLSDVELPTPEITLSNGEKINLSTYMFGMIRDTKVREDRELVMRSFFENRAKFRNTFAALLEGQIKSHYFNSKVYNFNTCLEAALKPKRINVEVYKNLIKTVKENLEPLHNYITEKKRLLGLSTIKYSDIYASSVVGVDKEYSIEEAISLVKESMKPLGEEYGKALDEGFSSRWMDIYANKAKRSGAYSNGSFYDGHPYVLMNFDGSFGDVSTLTHEFGHALHSYFSNKNNPYETSHYEIFLAEIASTFNENLLIEHIVKNEKDSEFKKYILDKHLDGLKGTLYRQTLFAEFELMIHEEVEKGKSLTADFLDETYLRLTREYYGHDKGIMEVEEFMKNEWSYIPHFYYNFYVYQYATGIVASMALAKMVLSNEENVKERYLNFLKSGGNDYPLNILKKAGVDLEKKEPVVEALKRFNDIVEELKKI